MRINARLWSCRSRSGEGRCEAALHAAHSVCWLNLCCLAMPRGQFGVLGITPSSGKPNNPIHLQRILFYLEFATSQMFRKGQHIYLYVSSRNAYAFVTCMAIAECCCTNVQQSLGHACACHTSTCLRSPHHHSWNGDLLM